ncbi:MAG TPA: DUF4157 domain-containing protein, partial [Burkholderiales bacterium]|nr:DUF4157 domain-containing protein [Burkholderiales bacterium]
MSGNKESQAHTPAPAAKTKQPSVEMAMLPIATSLQERMGNADLCALLQQVREYATPELETQADLIAAQVLNTAMRAIFARKRSPPSSRGELSARLAKSGAALSDNLRNFFEPRLGVSLDAVRVHTDERARAAAQSLNARAFAYGPHLVFNRDAYAPHTERGKALLAHELAHVAQQAHRQTLFIGLQPDKPTVDLKPASDKGIQQETGPGFLILKFPNG